MDKKPPQPIRTDLFRFVTIRTPQLISEEKKKAFYINHPRPSESFFLKNVNTDNIEEARKAVRRDLNSYTPVSTSQDIKDMAPDLCRFSDWLSRNRNSLTEKEVTDKVDKPGMLTNDILLKIWDELFYQALARNNPTVRQICIQLIIANNFLDLLHKPGIKKIAENIILTPKEPLPPVVEKRLELFLKRLANAKVVIPRAFSVKRQHTNPDKITTYPAEFPIGAITLKKQHLLSKTDYRADIYSKIKRELRLGINMLTTKEKDLAALAAATGDIAGFLSPDTRAFLEANPSKGVTLKMADDLINSKIKEENRRAVKAINAGPGSANRKGSGRSYEGIHPYCFVLSIDRTENSVMIIMTMYLGYSGAFLVSSDYNISFGNSDPVNAKNASEIDSDRKDILIMRLFPKDKLVLGQQSNFHLRGSMTFNNMVPVSFDVTGSVNTTVTHGCASTEDTNDNDTGPFQEGALYGVNRVGIGVFRKVEQEVCCYVPGEVSRIENVMAREYKERTTRSLISTETTEEDITEIEVENQSDTVSTARNELQTEVANELTKDNSIGTGASLGVEGKFPGGSVSADGYFDFASSTSSSMSDSAAQTYSEEVTNSALERVLQKTTQKRTSRILQEFEENNRHGFDNRQGDQHVTGVYRWIDIIYTNRLINYGKRLMFEFLIPEPAKFYKLALRRKPGGDSGGSAGDQLEEPKHPSEHGINSADDITEDNYLEMGRIYDVTLEDPITPEEDTITKSFGPGDDPTGDASPDAKENDYRFTVNFVETVDPSMYSAYEVSVDFNFDYHLKTGPGATEDGTYFILKVYNNTETYDKGNLADSDGTSESTSRNKHVTKVYPLPDIKNSLSVTAEIKNVYNFSINLVIKLKLDEQEQINWQNSVYDAIMKAYDAQVEEYNTAVKELEEEAQSEEDTAPVSNPEFNRTVEQREIQRIAIEMLTQPFGIQQGHDFYYAVDCKIPQVKQTPNWEIYSSHVKFFEQAFDWQLVAYLFYPYYWADKCDWVKLFQTKDASDPIFEAFLQSGMARAVIPVRQGFEEAVDYYMETGDIWNGGGLVLNTDDDLYLSIDEELQEVEGFVDKEWQTRVPTTLTIIQGRSVFLEDEGLPCCHKIEDAGVDTLLRSSETILGESTTTS